MSNPLVGSTGLLRIPPLSASLGGLAVEEKHYYSRYKETSWEASYWECSP